MTRRSSKKPALNEYNVDELVEVFVRDAKDLSGEWRKGVVVKKDTIHPEVGERFKPYPSLMVKSVRWYYRSYGGGDSLVWVDQGGETYAKPSIELYVYRDNVRKTS